MSARYEVRVLGSWAERLKGLLRSNADAGHVVLTACRSVHTFGMSYPIDVAFVAADGRVLKVVRRLPPGRVVSCRGGNRVIERPYEKGPWLETGQRCKLLLVVGGPSH